MKTKHRRAFSRIIDLTLALVIVAGAAHVGREVFRALYRVNSPFAAVANEVSRAGISNGY